ncbi:penicillin-binding protein [Halopseudomonas pelagia]|uniref:Penicillin-binding protein n=1 Tax=Halopseudomonas pelagia TaxID=553151 RepID=A0AA91Z5W2_9GAMM|nr:penicillin-binding protein [Halopseudomonas pelagia]PCC99422.1 penicillin-binding protein [Halopseudomonas pelagia]QFY57254.1 penicillin-binding protein [Halopseudomonas pelagia]
MSDKMSDDALAALKIAFTYMPKSMDVNRFDHGEDFQRILADIEQVREILLLNDVDPDEVEGELRPDSAPNSCY